MLNVTAFVKPSSINEALKLLQSKKWTIVAGATDVIPSIRSEHNENAISLMDINSLNDDVSRIFIDGEYLHVGSLNRISDIVESSLVKEYFPVLMNACRAIGSKQVRNRATIGGNIVNASPAADSVPALVAAGSSVVLKSHEGERVVDLEYFFSGPSKTVIKKNELMTAIRIPIFAGAWQGKYIKIGERNAMTIAVASVAILENEKRQFRVACGSVNPTVVRSRAVETFLNSDAHFDKQTVEEALKKDNHPINDVRGSAGYRLTVLANLLHSECQILRNSL